MRFSFLFYPGDGPAALPEKSLLYSDSPSVIALNRRPCERALGFKDQCSGSRSTSSRCFTRSSTGLADLPDKEHFLFYQSQPVEACQTIYSGNPFVESIKIAQYLRDRTSPSDQIAVLGSEPEIYFYAHRHSATGYIYTYGLVEGQPYALQMQREMVHEVELAHPKYLVVVGIGASWLSRPGVQHPIFDWISIRLHQAEL